MSDVNLSAKSAAKLTASSFLGTVVTWDFGLGKKADSVTVPRAKLVEALQASGYDPVSVGLLPVSTEDALERARTLGWGAGIRVNRLQAEKGTPASYGVMKTAVGLEDAIGTVGARIRIAMGGRIEVAEPLNSDYDSTCRDVAHKVVNFAEMLQGSAVNRDLSDLLLFIVKDIGAISMRHNSGGAYFLASTPESERFVKLLDTIETLTAHLPLEERFFAHITVIRGDQRNIATWHRNTTLAFDQEIARLAGELTDMAARDNVRDGTWDKKKTECTGLMLRAGKFAGVLSDQLARINAAIGILEQQFGSAQNNARAVALGAKAVFATFEEAKPAPVAAPPVAEPAPAMRRVRKDPRKVFESL